MYYHVCPCPMPTDNANFQGPKMISKCTQWAKMGQEIKLETLYNSTSNNKLDVRSN